jgi:signal recognition particle GTPase
MEVEKKYGMEDKKYETVFDKAWSESKEAIHSYIKETKKRIRTEISEAVDEQFRYSDMGIEEKEKLFSSLVKEKEDEIGIPQHQQMFDQMNSSVSDLIVNIFIPLKRKESDIEWCLRHHLSKDEIKKDIEESKRWKMKK